MKAIYINIDPYLQAVADWIGAGKPGTPSFQPLPLAVTIPLGESAAIYLPAAGTSEETQEANSVTVDGVGLTYGVGSVPWETVIASEVVPGISGLAPDSKYAVAPFGGGDVSVKIWDEDEIEYVVPFTVLVRREQASGPVDLVDFTPPAAAPTPSAADIKSALVAAGANALEGVKLGGAVILANPGSGDPLASPTLISVGNGDPVAAKYDIAENVEMVVGGNTAS